MKAIIKQVKKGKKKGEFRFTLLAGNGEVIAVSETYTQKHNVIGLLTVHFPSFKIEDKTV